MRTLIAILCMVAGLCRADVQVMTYAVELPQARLTELMSAAGDNGDRLFASVRAEVTIGGAKAIDTSLSRVRGGEKCVIESIGEVITPIEYDPPEVLAPQNPPLLRPTLRMPKSFISWETYNTGFSLEMEPTPVGTRIDLRMNWDYLARLEDYVIESWQDESGQHYLTPRPHYARTSTPAALTLRSGKWMLVSAVAAKTEKGAVDFSRKIVMFVKADLLETP